MDCQFYENISPENADCAWCSLYLINLDHQGRICERCSTDSDFRKSLRKSAMLRTTPDCKGDKTYCDIFDTVTDEEQCAKCKTDPIFRSFLYGQWVAKRNSTNSNNNPINYSCKHRGEVIGQTEKTCCGGKKKMVDLYRCALKGEVTMADCVGCGE